MAASKKEARLRGFNNNNKTVTLSNTLPVARNKQSLVVVGFSPMVNQAPVQYAKPWAVYYPIMNVLWHIDPLLGNDREISMCITTVTFPKHLLPIFMS
jgi:hypothetical protein